MHEYKAEKHQFSKYSDYEFQTALDSLNDLQKKSLEDILVEERRREKEKAMDLLREEHRYYMLTGEDEAEMENIDQELEIV